MVGLAKNALRNIAILTRACHSFLTALLGIVTCVSGDYARATCRHVRQWECQGGILVGEHESANTPSAFGLQTPIIRHRRRGPSVIAINPVRRSILVMTARTLAFGTCHVLNGFAKSCSIVSSGGKSALPHALSTCGSCGETTPNAWTLF